MTHTAQPAENADEPAQMRMAHTHWTNGQHDRLVAEHLGGDGEVRTAMLQAATERGIRAGHGSPIASSHPGARHSDFDSHGIFDHH
jgi:hypothetical protein